MSEVTIRVCDICNKPLHSEKSIHLTSNDEGVTGLLVGKDFHAKCLLKALKLEDTKAEIKTEEVKVKSVEQTASTIAPEVKKKGRPKKEADFVEKQEPVKPVKPIAAKVEFTEEGKRVDVPKILALYKARWRIEDIADEMGLEESVIKSHISAAESLNKPLKK